MNLHFLSVAAVFGLVVLAAPPVAQSVTITEYGPVAGVPHGITTGPDGNLWFADGNSGDGGQIGKITPEGVITEYGPVAGDPYGITTGPDGNLWFTDNTGGMGGDVGQIGKITPEGVITEYGPTFDDGHAYTPYIHSLYGSAITTGPDGNLWFTEHTRIGRITTAGVINESDPFAGLLSTYGITTGPDGNLWFTDYRDLSKVGKITTAGIITEYGGLLTGSLFDTAITAGPDGNLWFTEQPNKIGKITPEGVITEYGPVAGIPRGITVGPDGSLWFTDQGGFHGGSIGRITSEGVITEYESAGLSDPLFDPYGITTGPDGNLWFTDPGSNLIGRLVPETAAPPPTATPTVTSGPPCIGDCGGTKRVAVNNLVTLVNIALGNAEPSACPNGVPDGSEVNIALLIRAVNNALTGCPA